MKDLGIQVNYGAQFKDYCICIRHVSNTMFNGTCLTYTNNSEIVSVVKNPIFCITGSYLLS